MCHSLSFVPQSLACPGLEGRVFWVIPENGHALRHHADCADQLETPALVTVLFSGEGIGPIAVEAGHPFDKGPVEVLRILRQIVKGGDMVGLTVLTNLRHEYLQIRLALLTLRV